MGNLANVSISVFSLISQWLSFSQVVRDDGLLRGVQQGDPGLRDGDAGADQRLPPGVLRLPAVQPQVRTQPRAAVRIGDRPFPITSINCRTPKGAPFLLPCPGEPSS